MNRRSLLSFVGAAALAISTAVPFATPAGAQVSGGSAVGAVYTMTNAPDGNAIVIFDRDGKGALTPAGSVPTGGSGSGGGLDPLASQGSLALTQDHRWLLAVNAGSNDISVFRVDRDGLKLVDNIESGGVFPTSLTVVRDLVYVLNAGGVPNITGFTLSHEGLLAPIAGSTRPLAAGLHSQVGFDPQGNLLVVTDRSSNSLLVYPVRDDGTPASSPIVSPSSGAGPFSFVFGAPGRLLVAEVGANAVSSYEVRDDGTLQVINPSIPNGQAATCWIAGAGSGFAFTANPGASSLSSYRQQPGTGDLAILAGAAGTGTRPLDLAATTNGRFLYALDPGSAGIDAFEIQADGSLINLGPVSAGLPGFAQGLAAR
jgi:6-phosphogluconolactonase (cycloisomerase 2 family)